METAETAFGDDSKKIAELAAAAQAYVQQGKQSDLQGDFPHAEEAYLSALRIYEFLFEKTGLKTYSAEAKEICELLADLLMQQGNMHGADVYYARVLAYTGFNHF